MIGTVITRRGGDSRRRETAAQQALARLASTDGVECVNVAFIDDVTAGDLIPVLPVLRLDSRALSGAAGIRKAIVSEVIDALACEAERRGIGRVALANGDIIVTPLAAARIAASDRPAIAIARTDSGGGEAEAQLLYGVDMFVFDVAFWRRERKRFRAYPVGEAVWDNVYAAIAVAHGGELLNRERLILHERHERRWEESPFARYVHLLAARDHAYFSLWCRYVAAAAALRKRGGTAEEELALQRTIFHPPGVLARAGDIARAGWWRIRRAVGR